MLILFHSDGLLFRFKGWFSMLVIRRIEQDVGAVFRGFFGLVMSLETSPFRLLQLWLCAHACSRMLSFEVSAGFQ